MNEQENKDEVLKEKNDDEDNASATGKRGKLGERIKKIARDKRKYKNNGTEEDSDRNSYGSLKRFLLIPVMFLGGFLGKRSVPSKENKQKSYIGSIKNKDNLNKENKLVGVEGKIWTNKVNGRRFVDRINKNSQKKVNIRDNKQRLNDVNNYKDNGYEKDGQVNLNNNQKKEIKEVNTYKRFFKKQNVKNNVSDEEKKEVELLEKEILKLIKKRLVKLINEYEVLGSDFYILKELLTDDIYYDKCLQNVKEIKKLLSKINSLKDKYDYLKDNIDFDNLLELDDAVLQEKIIELRNKVEGEDLNYLVKDYKLLNEYKSLYLKIDKLQSQAYEYEDERKKRVDALKEKKIDFEKFKLSVYNYKIVGEEYSYFVKMQNKLLDELSEKVGKIDSYEKVEYIYDGYQKILTNSFKYIGLLLLSPLKGLIPGIATQTIVTKNVLDNLKKSLVIEEKRKMVYEAINYEAEISRAVNDMDYMTMVIDSSLSDVAELKRKYKERFKKDESSYREYQDAIKQLNKIENSIIGSKVKVEIMRERMEVNRKINEDKMVKVRKLNLQEDNKR